MKYFSSLWIYLIWVQTSQEAISTVRRKCINLHAESVVERPMRSIDQTLTSGLSIVYPCTPINVKRYIFAFPAHMLIWLEIKEKAKTIRQKYRTLQTTFNHFTWLKKLGVIEKLRNIA